MTVPMEKLDDLVANHLEKRLLNSARLEEILSTVLYRRQERSERKQQHIAELNKRATRTDLRLKRLYDAIESGVADLGDADLKDRIASLKSTRDHFRALAQWVEVDTGEVRIMGSKSNLLQTLAAGAGTGTKLGAVPSFVPKWCARQDSNLLPQD